MGEAHNGTGNHSYFLRLLWGWQEIVYIRHSSWHTVNASNNGRHFPWFPSSSHSPFPYPVNHYAVWLGYFLSYMSNSFTPCVLCHSSVKGLHCLSDGLLQQAISSSHCPSSILYFISRLIPKNTNLNMSFLCFKIL